MVGKKHCIPVCFDCGKEYRYLSFVPKQQGSSNGYSNRHYLSKARKSKRAHREMEVRRKIVGARGQSVRRRLKGKGLNVSTSVWR